ncbi:MAG TPA: D-xylose ABC transporter ATP-binding protein [Verrucomicrobiales bacterium]|nr:D-xylose ABC transporter ATP-binding protein [Verrucomicrobiales bacterium]
MAAASPSPLLTVERVTKSFPGVRALKGVSLQVQSGEVLAVIGENGAGKSTLMKILAGVQEPDSGTITIDGKPARLDSVLSALRHGIALIHQELNLADNLSAAANIFLGREPRRGPFIDFASMNERATKFLKDVGLRIPPTTLVRSLTIGRQQLIEIAKALSVNARLLIMDEPTSSLSAAESETLFAVIRQLRERGVSVVYISHRLGEVRELADRVVVLRDGENAGELSRAEATHENMVRHMVGRDLSQFYARRPHPAGDVVLELKGLRSPVWPQHAVSFALRAGEIVGLAGLVGAGRTELLQTIFGVVAPAGGTMTAAGRPFIPQSPRDAIETGIALVPEDRKQEGLVLGMDVAENLSLPSLRRDQRRGFLNFPREREISTEMIDGLRIKTPSAAQIVQFLSGGNQQKVVLGKWLALDPKVLLLDEPTRGIDIGAKREIYALMDQLAARGVAILFASSEMEEVLGMSDRVLVMHEGRLSGEVARAELSEETVMHLATGGDRREAA